MDDHRELRRRSHLPHLTRPEDHAVYTAAEADTGAPAPFPVRSDPMDCAWLGQPTGDLVECPSCSGTVKLKVFACQLFETTHYRQCQTCTERRPRA